MNCDEDCLLDCDATWPERFSELAARVKTALGVLVLQEEHIGNTAFPGFISKPVIDVDVVLVSLPDLPEAIRRLAIPGYVHEGELGIVGRESFLWPDGEDRHHLYVLTADASELQRHLAFREALHADPTFRSLGYRDTRRQNLPS